ncbi:MAG: hypothetical protein DRP45_03415 [Candidatus Zixiibacteriota bacterium]|nr:MAG: hypothetical protein DRP45_03415 [candidate division Zixibacteria bacterium]
MTATPDIRELIERGERHFLNGDAARAEDCFRSVLDTDTNNIDALNNLGVIAFTRGELDQAERWLRRSIEIQPNNTDALVNLSTIRSERGEFADARELASRILKIEPDNTEALNQFDSCTEKLGAPTQVRETVTHSLGIDGDQPVVQQKQKKASSTGKLTITRPQEQRQRTSEYQSKISILLPTYNRAALLEETLANLTEQDHPNFEIIVVDDCSTDSTPEVVKRFAGKHECVVYHRNEVNQGAIANRNRAASYATGDYLLCFCDDDLLAPGALREWIAPLENDDCDMIYADFQVIDSTGRKTELWKYEAYDDKNVLLRRLIQQGCNVIPEAILLKRELFDEIYGEAFDRRFITPFYLATLDRLKLAHVAKPLYHYRIHSEGMFANRSGLLTRNKGVTNHINAVLFKYNPVRVLETGDAPSTKKAVGEALLRAAGCLIQHGTQFVSGTFYTGNEYTRSDGLYAIFYEFAYYWLRLARKYLGDDARINEAENAIAGQLTETYDPVAVNELPEVYRRLPWYCFRPSHNYTKYIPLDMATAGTMPPLDQPSYQVYREGKIDISVNNEFVDSIEDLELAMARGFIRVVNVCRSGWIEPVVRMLEEKRLFFVTVINFTDDPTPESELILNVFKPSTVVTSFDDHLRLLCDNCDGIRWQANRASQDK